MGSTWISCARLLFIALDNWTRSIQSQSSSYCCSISSSAFSALTSLFLCRCGLWAFCYFWTCDPLFFILFVQVAVWVSSNVCPVFFLSLLLRPTSLCSSEVARLASSRHTSASQVLRYEHQVAKCPQVSTRINAIRMIRYGIILPLTQLTTN